MQECTIGYFHHEGRKFAGKNREPGKNSLDTLVIKTRYIKTPKLLYIGVDPTKIIPLDQEILHAFEENRILTLEKDLDIQLFYLTQGEISSVIDQNLFPNKHFWGGIYPSHRVGLPAASPIKAVFMLPTQQQTVIGNYSSHNFDCCWGGVNEQGLFIQSSSIRHGKKLKRSFSYSQLINDMLLKCESVSQAIDFLQKSIQLTAINNAPAGGNFLIADQNCQAIIEYIPADILNAKEHSFIVSQGENQAFRTNFALESRFFQANNWQLDKSNTGNVEQFIRNINRLIVAYAESRLDVFSSHTVYEDLFDRKILREICHIMYTNDLRDIKLSSPKQFPSFYSICTHPITQGNQFHTHKRTFWTMIADLAYNKVLLSYDNPCQSGARIEIEPGKINSVLAVLKDLGMQ